MGCCCYTEPLRSSIFDPYSVRCHDKQTGEVLWTCDTGFNVLNASQLSDGSIICTGPGLENVFVTAGKIPVARVSASGQLMWSVSLENSSVSSGQSFAVGPCDDWFNYTLEYSEATRIMYNAALDRILNIDTGEQKALDKSWINPVEYDLTGTVLGSDMDFDGYLLWRMTGTGGKEAYARINWDGVVDIVWSIDGTTEAAPTPFSASGGVLPALWPEDDYANSYGHYELGSPVKKYHNKTIEANVTAASKTGSSYSDGRTDIFTGSDASHRNGSMLMAFDGYQQLSSVTQGNAEYGLALEVPTNLSTCLYEQTDYADSNFEDGFDPEVNQHGLSTLTSSHMSSHQVTYYNEDPETWETVIVDGFEETVKPVLYEGPAHLDTRDYGRYQLTLRGWSGPTESEWETIGESVLAHYFTGKGWPAKSDFVLAYFAVTGSYLFSHNFYPGSADADSDGSDAHQWEIKGTWQWFYNTGSLWGNDTLAQNIRHNNVASADYDQKTHGLQTKLTAQSGLSLLDGIYENSYWAAEYSFVPGDGHKGDDDLYNELYHATNYTGYNGADVVRYDDSSNVLIPWYGKGRSGISDSHYTSTYVDYAEKPAGWQWPAESIDPGYDDTTDYQSYGGEEPPFPHPLTTECLTYYITDFPSGSHAYPYDHTARWDDRSLTTFDLWDGTFVDQSVPPFGTQKVKNYVQQHAIVQAGDDFMFTCAEYEENTNALGSNLKPGSVPESKTHRDYASNKGLSTLTSSFGDHGAYLYTFQLNSSGANYALLFDVTDTDEFWGTGDDGYQSNTGFDHSTHGGCVFNGKVDDHWDTDTVNPETANAVVVFDESGTELWRMQWCVPIVPDFHQRFEITPGEYTSPILTMQPHFGFYNTTQLIVCGDRTWGRTPIITP